MSPNRSRRLTTEAALRNVASVSITVCPRLPARHSLRHGPHLAVDDFSRQKPEAPAYPSVKVFLTQFGIVSDWIYRQALDAPFMVELFAVVLSNSSPSLVIGPVVCIAADELPTPANVERTRRALHPLDPHLGGLWSEPRGGISRLESGSCQRRHPLHPSRLAIHASLSRSPGFKLGMR